MLPKITRTQSFGKWCLYTVRESAHSENLYSVAFTFTTYIYLCWSM